MTEENKLISPHTLLLENRERLSITGVSDVDSFDDSLITAFTKDSRITITGQELHIGRLCTEEGELLVEGRISSLVYRDDAPKATSFFGWVFR